MPSSRSRGRQYFNVKLEILVQPFSKGWQKGDPGATYVASDLDESSIIFEPYNLENTMVIFQDAVNAIHGARYLEKDVERRAYKLH